MRIESQYYVSRSAIEEDIDEIAKLAPAFVIKCRNVCNRIKTKDIEEIRERIQRS